LYRSTTTPWKRSSRGSIATAVIRELAGHADICTTTVYTAVSSARLVDAVDERQRQRRGVSRATR
jgi:site-specific recombinase XerC